MRLRFAIGWQRAPGTVSVAAALFPYDPDHQTFLNIYEGDALTQAILDRGRTRFEYFAGTRQGVAGGRPQVRAGRHSPHPDRARPSAVSGRAAAARRHDPAAARRRHRLHRRAQHHAVARRAQSRQPAGADHRAGDRAEHRLRRRGQSAGARRTRRAGVDRVRLRVHSRLRLRQRAARDGSAARGRSAGRCSRSTSASKSVNCSSWSSSPPRWRRCGRAARPPAGGWRSPDRSS